MITVRHPGTTLTQCISWIGRWVLYPSTSRKPKEDVRRCQGTLVRLGRVLQLPEWPSLPLASGPIMSQNCALSKLLDCLLSSLAAMKWIFQSWYLMKYYSGIMYFLLFASGPREKVERGTLDWGLYKCLPLLHCLALHLLVSKPRRLCTQKAMCVSVRSTCWPWSEYIHFWTLYTHTHTQIPHRPFLLPVRSWLGPLELLPSWWAEVVWSPVLSEILAWRGSWMWCKHRGKNTGKWHLWQWFIFAAAKRGLRNPASLVFQSHAC